MGLNRRRFCCLIIPCCNSRRSAAVGFNWWQRIGRGENSEKLWWDSSVKAVKKIREWSEIVAGPKWKTFIRRFNRGVGGGVGGGIGGGGGGKSGKFQYDPLSYALNFEDGLGQNEDIEFQRNFSSRYALINGLKKSPTATEESV
ncbi:uncharacterized protein LOC124918084 [Impatiens glandulifera]|uniref:uncharacterized protein LOC124918084 n=1 Tax=Impatiens glandulifera TaxID=253017 RepID=UPI001FB080A8|nr:uncharacterized protein LOC124918084 [Impatiens glandulifera]